MNIHKSCKNTFISLRYAYILSAFVLQVLANQAFAKDAFNDYEDVLNHVAQASDEELDQLRGGFLLPNGINVNFNYESVVSLNGVVKMVSAFQLPDNVALLQNGLDNQAQQLNLPALGTVIQNNLDNQFIQTLNTVNIELSNLKNMSVNHGGAMFNALIMPNL
jgi:hypothetical protein